MEIDIKIFRMNRLGIPQERIAARLGIVQASIHNHLSKGFTVPQVAEKHGWGRASCVVHRVGRQKRS